MAKSPTSFFWYELMTTDIDAASDFYAAVVGWKPQDFAGSPGMPRYIVVNAGERGVGGIMGMLEQAGPATPPAWTGYIKAQDTDAATKAVKDAGGEICWGPDDIPGVGRFSVVADPQGAVFKLLHPDGPEQPEVPHGTPGHIGWHELYTTDWRKALAFYSSQFGWTKNREFDMGEMGTYAIFAAGADAIGGMMNKPEQIPVPCWQFYFNVTAIDDAAKRVTDKGGKVLMGPMEVPGGSWIVQCQDPQGAHFALTAPKR
ncbi:VOC family protein [Manganibacter manganicus]|uniref:Glyoxalase n=1 Tax=Manganibacter manganicus TaxID=1873176 RepID=A0A1V8RVS8_9HYPH|nr:VOC family protein [Pseudaminobacter manganicus]OQM77311.1 glyoxalase [Pseudaminobacter manganicus]